MVSECSLRKVGDDGISARITHHGRLALPIRREVIMTEYKLYQRDDITGHLVMIATFASTSDFGAASMAKRHADGKAAVLYQNERAILHFGAKPRLTIVK